MFEILCYISWVTVNLRLWYVLLRSKLQKDLINFKACISVLIPTLLLGWSFWIVLIMSRVLKKYNG